MGASHSPETDRTLSALCFLYLTFSHATDNDLADDELAEIVRCVRAWVPGRSIHAADDVLERAFVLYSSVPSRVEKLKTASRCAHSLRETLDAERLGVIIHDLARIAAADGQILDEERRFVLATAQSFGVDFDPAVWD